MMRFDECCGKLQTESKDGANKPSFNLETTRTFFCNLTMCINKRHLVFDSRFYFFIDTEGFFPYEISSVVICSSQLQPMRVAAVVVRGQYFLSCFRPTVMMGA